MRLVQLVHKDGRRRVALVAEPTLEVLRQFSSTYELVSAALAAGTTLTSFVEAQSVESSLPYDAVYSGDADWRLLAPVDHPQDPSRCLISGTGLTHTASAEKRRAMHAHTETENDSIRMYRWGREQGRPAPGSFGIAPEWFYKGTGAIVRAHGEALVVPPFAEDAGEEAELAGIYLIDAAGRPRRIGMAAGNEFADHRHEKRNYLYLAASKLRQCSLGPELNLTPEFNSVQGEVKVERAGQVVWCANLASGEANMCHSLANLEHHHFKFPEHRHPGDLHIHFFGADAFSFGEGMELADQDIVEISFAGMGRPLRNPICFDRAPDQLISVLPA